MVFLILTGVMSLLSLKTETFPEAAIDIVEVILEYPGESPAEIE